MTRERRAFRSLYDAARAYHAKVEMAGDAPFGEISENMGEAIDDACAALVESRPTTDDELAALREYAEAGGGIDGRRLLGLLERLATAEEEREALRRELEEVRAAKATVRMAPTLFSTADVCVCGSTRFTVRMGDVIRCDRCDRPREGGGRWIGDDE